MPFQHDIGTVIEVEILDNGEVFSIPVGATTQLRLKKPNGQVVTKTASLQTDGSDGMIEYITINGDLDQIGTWYMQGVVAYSGNRYSSEIGNFEVKEILRNKF